MKTATHSKRNFEQTKLLVINNERVTSTTLESLEKHLVPGDVLVFNDSFTLPSSFTGVHTASGSKVEVRLLQSIEGHKVWKAFALGAGQWQTPTELRPQPPQLNEGDEILIGKSLTIRILAISNNLLEIGFEGDRPLEDILKYGQPIQYSYLQEELKIWDQQNLFSKFPVSLEPASASFNFNWQSVERLKKHGVHISLITHSTGVSSSGYEDVDKMLPVEEKYFIPKSEAKRLNQAIDEGRRVIAVGTGVSRAIESAYRGGRVRSGAGVAKVIFSRNTKPKILSGIVTGMHEYDSSHWQLLESFVEPNQLKRAYVKAAENNFLLHEYGDLAFIAV